MSLGDTERGIGCAMPKLLIFYLPIPNYTVGHTERSVNVERQRP